MEMKFRDVINNIKEGEIWVNKNAHRRLKSIECLYGNITFYLDDFYKSFGVNLNDEFILERKEFDTGYAMQELKKGKIIESTYDNEKFKMEGNNIYTLLDEGKGDEEWRTYKYPFNVEQILHNWYVEN